MKKLYALLFGLALIVANLAVATQPTFTAGTNVGGAMVLDPVNSHAANAIVVSPTGGTVFGSLSVNGEGFRPTYRYATLAFAPVATPTAFLVIQGSATKTVRVKYIRLSGQATSAGNQPIFVSRWSTAGTAGSAVLSALTAVKHDTNDNAATAVVSTVGTANYTTEGSGSSTALFADHLQMTASGSGVAVVPIVLDFASRADKAVVLRGTSDYLVIDGNGIVLPAGAKFDISVETEEDGS